MKKETLLSIVLRGTIFLFIWWILTNGEVASLWVGVPAVVLASAVSISLLPPTPLLLRKVLLFMPYFLIHSFKGAVDVAWRVFDPKLPIKPDFIHYELTLPPGLAQVFMVNIVSLVPGTLSAQLQNNLLTIHVLDNDKNFQVELHILEKNIAKIFGLTEKNDRKGE
jgi:multicomponent Na+:H+ antiporter subunit E